MIRYPARHLFEAKFPELEPDEEEIFFPHPRWEGIRCNQIGVVYHDEEKYSHIATEHCSMFRSSHKPYSIVGNKEVVVYECYTGGNWRGSQFYHINGNPYDFCYDNLLPCTDQKHPKKQEAMSTKKRFYRESLEFLFKLEAKWEKFGIEPEELHKMLCLPRWLLSLRKRNLKKT